MPNQPALDGPWLTYVVGKATILPHRPGEGVLLGRTRLLLFLRLISTISLRPYDPAFRVHISVPESLSSHCTCGCYNTGETVHF